MDGFWLCKGDPRRDNEYPFDFWTRWYRSGLDAVFVDDTAPDGGQSFRMTAQAGAAPSTKSISDYSVTLYNMSYHNASFIAYVKLRGDQESLAFRIRPPNATAASAIYLNLVTGQQTVHSYSIAPDNIHLTYESIGNGWFRVMTTLDGSAVGIVNDDVTGGFYFTVGLVEPGSVGTEIYTGSSDDGIFIWKVFAFYSEDVYHYYPDCPTSTTSSNYTTSASVRFEPDWSSKILNTQRRFDSSDQSGRRSQYITGSYDKWSFNVPMLESDHAHMINKWWREREPVYFYNGLTHTSQEVVITNKSEPFSWARNPYHSILTGVLDLESV